MYSIKQYVSHICFTTNAVSHVWMQRKMHSNISLMPGVYVLISLQATRRPPFFLDYLVAPPTTLFFLFFNVIIHTGPKKSLTDFFSPSIQKFWLHLGLQRQSLTSLGPSKAVTDLSWAFKGSHWPLLGLQRDLSWAFKGSHWRQSLTSLGPSKRPLLGLKRQSLTSLGPSKRPLFGLQRQSLTSLGP